MLFVSPAPGIDVRLERCDGQRIEEGAYVDCVPGCVAHFEPDSDTEMHGDVPNRYENSVLSWVALTRGAQRVYLQPDLAGEERDWLRAYETSSLLYDADCRLIRVWVVLTHPSESLWHRAVVFTRRAAVEAYVSELLDPETKA